MNDNIKDSTNTINENADNMAQNEETPETAQNSGEEETLDPGSWLFPEQAQELEKLRGELDESKDKHLRLIAEFDNLRRRQSKEKLELIETASKDLIQSLLVVLDDMSRAEKQIDNTTDVTAIKEGITLVFNKFRTILQSKGLKEMEAMKEEFNPDLHEALTEIPAPTEEMKGKIIDVMEPGYYLKSKLIRHAKVIVGK